MTDPWCWYIIYANKNLTDMGYIDGIHGTPYIYIPYMDYIPYTIYTIYIYTIYIYTPYHISYIIDYIYIS